MKYPCHRIVVTGGEPLLQQVQLSSFIENIRFLENGYTIEIETNGTIAISQEFLLDIAHNNRLQINCSPKLSSSDNLFSSCIKPSVLQQLNTFPGTCFKFVIRDESDFNEVYDIVSSCRLDHDKIILMPEGTDPEILKNRSFWIVEKAKKLDWRFTMRLQCELYGNKRGV